LNRSHLFLELNKTKFWLQTKFFYVTCCLFILNTQFCHCILYIHNFLLKKCFSVWPKIKIWLLFRLVNICIIAVIVFVHKHSCCYDVCYYKSEVTRKPGKLFQKMVYRILELFILFSRTICILWFSIRTNVIKKNTHNIIWGNNIVDHKNQYHTPKYVGRYNRTPSQCPHDEVGQMRVILLGLCIIKIPSCCIIICIHYGIVLYYKWKCELQGKNILHQQ